MHIPWRCAHLSHSVMQHLMPPPCLRHSRFKCAPFLQPVTLHGRPPPCNLHLPKLWEARVHPLSRHREPPPWRMHNPRLCTLLSHPILMQRFEPPCRLHRPNARAWLLHPSSQHNLRRSFGSSIKKNCSCGNLRSSGIGNPGLCPAEKSPTKKMVPLAARVRTLLARKGVESVHIAPGPSKELKTPRRLPTVWVQMAVNLVALSLLIVSS